MTSLADIGRLSQPERSPPIPPGKDRAPVVAGVGRAPDWVWLSLILVTALVCRGAFLASREVWFDEAFSWRLASLPAGRIPAVAASDHHPPLYFLLLCGWLKRFGDSPVALRAPSLLAGLATIVGIYLFVREVVGGPWGCFPQVPGQARLAALTTAALVALSPFQIHYSMEARMYALGAALSVFSAWVLLRGLAPGRTRWRYWIGLALLDLLFIYTHNFALLTVAAQGLFVGGWLLARAGRRWRTVWRQPRLGPACVAFGLVAVGYAPWLPALAHQVNHPEIRAWLPALTSPWQVLDLIYQALTDSGAPGGAPAALAAVLFVLPCLVAVGRRGRAGDWLVLTLATVPLALMVTACLAGMRLLHPRYLNFAQPFLLAAIGMTVARLRPRPVGDVMAAVLVATNGCVCLAAGIAILLLEDCPSYRGAARYLARQRRPGEAIVVADGLAYLPIRYYCPDRTDLYVHPGSHKDGVWVAWVLAPGEILESSRMASWSGRRVWVANLVGTDPPTSGRVAISMDNTVPVPPEWRLCSRVAFKRDGEGEIEVLEYEAPASRF